MVTRHIGNCQICEADQKLHSGRMVHHGYKRPGHGSIQGDCPGVGYLPYELGTDVLVDYVDGLEKSVRNLSARLDALESGKVTSILVPSRTRRYELVEYVAGVTELGLWLRSVSAAMDDVRWNRKSALREIERCEKRLVDWKPLPLRTVEEEELKTRAAKADRAAVVAAKRAERAAKEAAKVAKKDALHAKRFALLEGFASVLAAAKADPGDASKYQAACKVLLKLRTKAFGGWLFYGEVNSSAFQQAMLAIGCATQNANGIWVDPYKVPNFA